MGVANSLVANSNWLNVFQSLQTSRTAHTSKCGNDNLKTVIAVETNLLAYKKVFMNKQVATRRCSASLYTLNVMHIFHPIVELTLARLVCDSNTSRLVKVTVSVPSPVVGGASLHLRWQRQ